MTSAEQLKLASDFPAATRDQWRTLVEGVLRRSGVEPAGSAVSLLPSLMTIVPLASNVITSPARTSRTVSVQRFDALTITVGVLDDAAPFDAATGAVVGAAIALNSLWERTPLRSVSRCAKLLADQCHSLRAIMPLRS